MGLFPEVLAAGNFSRYKLDSALRTLSKKISVVEGTNSNLGIDVNFFSGSFSLG